MAELNPMCQQVQSLSQLLVEQQPDLERKTRTVFTTPEIYSFQKIILTGCGDSFIAAQSMQAIFELLTEIPTEAVPALDLARYYHPKFVGTSPNTPLVIFISNSGQVARLAEGAQFIKAFGGMSLAITGNPESPLGKEADRILKLDIPSFVPSPGVRSYMVSVLALYLLAIRIGEVRQKYTMDQAGFWRDDVFTLAKAMDQRLPKIMEQASALADAWNDKTCFEFVGAGFDYAAAAYGAAKMFEATGDFTTLVDSEEWFHRNCFIKDIDHLGGWIVTNSTNPGKSRTHELIKVASTFRDCAIVTDKLLEDVDASIPQFIVPVSEAHITMPLAQFIPFACFAGFLAEKKGSEYGRGSKGSWSFTAGGAGVKNSEIVVRKALLK